ncbi:uncharacterized protein [Onthophagus taurus]|uniref:uncharacterized protein n=1 Tax=Onthophagus taurus TaxID=166361 RepID=UPI0039BE2FBD
MDKIRSNHSRYQSRLSITNGSKNYYPSRDTIYFEDDFADDTALEEEIPEYQLAEMQRRKKHFDEFKKLYNNKLVEKEARKRAEEEEKHDAFLQHPISILLSKYGFKIPKNKQMSNNNLQNLGDYKRTGYRNGSRSRCESWGSSNSRTRINCPPNEFALSDMEIVDIFQRSTESFLTYEDKPMQSEDEFSTSSSVREHNVKLRGDIAELEQRFNNILQSFHTTTPLRCRFVNDMKRNTNVNNEKYDIMEAKIHHGL